MRRLAVLVGWAVLVLSAVTPLSAAITPELLVLPTGSPTGGSYWTYDIRIDNSGTRVNANQRAEHFLTIFDVNGLVLGPNTYFVPSATLNFNAGTDFVTQLSGTTPQGVSPLTPDSPYVWNITLYFNATNQIVGPQSLGILYLESTYAPIISTQQLDDYGYQATRHGGIGVDGTDLYGGGQTVGPATPEPMSMGLLGGGLALIGLLRRRKA